MHDRRNLHHNQRRLGFRACLVGCLVLLQIAAHAQTAVDPAYDRFKAVITGNTAAVSFGSDGTALAVPKSFGMGHVATGLSPTAGEVSRHAALVTKYGDVPFKVSQTITVGKLAKGLAALAGGPLGIGLLALEMSADWLADSGVGVTADGPVAAGVVSRYYGYGSHATQGTRYPETGFVVFGDTFESACGAVLALANHTRYFISGNACHGKDAAGYAYTFNLTSYACPSGQYWVGESCSTSPPASGPVTAAEVEALLNASPRTQSEIEKILSETIKYPEIEPDPVDWVRIDPINPGDYIKSPTKTDHKTTTNPDGSKIEETKSCWLKGTVQTGASLKLTEVCNTDTVTKSPTGTVTGTTTATTDSETADAATPDADDGGLCDTLIGKLICTDLGDAPTDEIPKVTKDLSYTPEVLFGSGSCPADKVVTLGALTLPLTNMAQTCGWLADFVKPLAILLATFSATLIIIGAPKE